MSEVIYPPLSDTKWKLVGIVNATTGALKALAPIYKTYNLPNCARRYTLIFENLVSDMSYNSFITYTTFNELVDIYGINNENQSFFIRIAGGTKVAEHWDGPLFIDCINAVQSFSLRKNELRLYYNNNKIIYSLNHWNHEKFVFYGNNIAYILAIYHNFLNNK